MKASTNNKAVAYIRVSTNKQELSPQAQQDLILGWAKENNIEVVSWNEDKISGSKPIEQRPGLKQALNDIVRFKATRLVVSKRDRLARDIMIMGAVRVFLNKHKAILVSVAGEGTEGTSPADELVGSIIDSVSKFERLQTGERTKVAMRTKAMHGRLATTPPYGWKLTTLETKEDILEKNEQEQIILKRILELRKEGCVLTEIVSKLVEEQLYNRKGKPFSRVQIGRLIHYNPDLAGGRVIQDAQRQARRS